MSGSRFAVRVALAASVSSVVLFADAGAGARVGAREPEQAHAATTRFQVTQVEYRLLLSRTVVKAGRVDLRELDRGHEQHDLRLRGSGSGAGEVRGKLLRPGTSWEGVVYLQPGTYKLWCSLPEHAKHGMHAVLQVVR